MNCGKSGDYGRFRAQDIASNRGGVKTSVLQTFLQQGNKLAIVFDEKHPHGLRLRATVFAATLAFHQPFAAEPCQVDVIGKG